MDDFSKYQDQLNQVSGQLNEQNVLESAEGAKEKAKVMAERFKDQVISGVTDPIGLGFLENSVDKLAEAGGVDTKGGVYGVVKNKIKQKLNIGTDEPAPVPAKRLPPTPEEIESRSKLDKNIKFREGDIKPEDIVRGNNTLEDLRNNNEARYTAISKEDRLTANDMLENRQGYRKLQDINSDNTLSEEQKNIELQNNYFNKQDVIGDVEALDKPHGLGSAVPGGSSHGIDKQITGKMSDDVEGGLAEATEDSTEMDDNPVSIAITAGLGLLTLFSGIFGHKKDEARHTPTLPAISNPSTQFGS
jgi:hypothetical protein